MKPPGFITRPLLDYVVEEPRLAPTCGLRKAPEAHIRMRVINTFEPVAQSVEHVTFNHGVQGSNPCGLTIIAGYSNSFLAAYDGLKQDG